MQCDVNMYKKEAGGGQRPELSWDPDANADAPRLGVADPPNDDDA